MKRPWPRRVPPTTVVTDPALDDDELRRVRDEVLATGDWRPAADLLARTGPDPDRRGHRADALAQAVAPDPAWADRWIAEHPDDAGALLVRAWGEIHRAWDARGDGYGDTVPAQAGDEFLRRLARAATLCERAVDAAPGDPVARVPPLWLAIGQSATHATFRRRWDALVARDPLNRQGHVAALQYWCAKWHGSDADMHGFARRAAEQAPGTWAVVLPLQAHVEWNLNEEQAGVRRSLDAAKTWEHSPGIRADIDAALAWARTTPGHAMALHDLSVVAFTLVQALRLPEADALPAALGYRVSAYPWDHDDRGPEKAFRGAVKQIGWWLWSEQLG